MWDALRINPPPATLRAGKYGIITSQLLKIETGQN
jgi:hypothetical protein